MTPPRAAGPVIPVKHRGRDAGLACDVGSHRRRDVGLVVRKARVPFVERQLNREAKLPAIAPARQMREFLRRQGPMLNQFFGRPQLLHRSALRLDSAGKPTGAVRSRPSDGHFAQLRGHWANEAARAAPEARTDNVRPHDPAPGN
jgi:hypothetical protein